MAHSSISHVSFTRRELYLRFDSTGHVTSPEEGWNTQDIFVHLAHGHRSSCTGVSSVNNYNEATDRFERSVGLVQKMLAQSAMFSPSKTSRKSSISSSKSVSPEQSENEEKSLLNKLTAENESLKRRVDELVNELETEKNEGEKEQSESTNDSHEIVMLKERASTAETRLEEAEKMAECANRRAAIAERALKEECEVTERALENENRSKENVKEVNERLIEAEGRVEKEVHGRTEAENRERKEKERAEKAEWSLGEHVQWMNDARQRVKELEGEMEERRIEVNSMRERAERSEWRLGEHTKWLEEEKMKNQQLESQCEWRIRELNEKIQQTEDEMERIKHSMNSPQIVLPEPNEEEFMKEDVESVKGSPMEIEEEMFQMRKVTTTEAVQPSPPNETIDEDKERIAQLEYALEEAKTEAERIVEEKLIEGMRRTEEVVKELAVAKKRLQDETAHRVLEVNSKIQELTDKEEELNNLHNLIEELRDQLKELEKKHKEAEWHLGEHRDWLKNERDKVTYLEEQVRKIQERGENTTSRPVSRKNSTESGFGSIPVTERDHERSGSESPPERVKMKLSSSALPDDLALEMMTLSKAKQRMAEEIRELKTRIDPAVLENERRQMGEQLRTVNERCQRLTEETARYKDIAARVNMDTFNAQEGIIQQLEKEKRDLEWKIGEDSQAINDAQWRIGELKEELRRVNEEGMNDEELKRMREEKERLQRRVNELETESNSHKWRIGELESGYAHHKWLLSQAVSTEEANGLRGRIHELEGYLSGAHKAENDAKWRIGELEEELRKKNNQNGNSEEERRLREEKENLEGKCTQLEKERNDLQWRIGELESGYAHHEWLLSQRSTHEESDGLKRRIHELEHLLSEAKKAENDAKWRIGELEKELSEGREGESNEELLKEWNDQKWRIGELESGYAYHEYLLSQRITLEESQELKNKNRELVWKIGEVEKEGEDARRRVNEVEEELRKVRDALNAERPGQLEENLRTLRNEKENHERRVNELDKMFNDTKWRNGELDATIAWLRSQLDEQRAKVARIYDNREDQDYSNRDGTFVVRHRRPGDAKLWQLTPKTRSDETEDLRSVTFVIEEKRETDAVFVIGGFSAWECCARLSQRKGSWMREVTLHLPKGRHEFRFIVEGGWANSTQYPTVPNPFGTTNNWISVD